MTAPLITNQVIGCYDTQLDFSPTRKTDGGLRTYGIYKSSKPGLPLVTVITTVYNRATVIEKAICSILSQTYPNIEYIIIDAKSHDQTLDVIKKYDDKVDYFFSEPDGGMYEGMNKGLQLAKGDYIIILNSDDWYIESAIESLVNSAIRNNADFVSALAIETDWFGNITRKIPELPFRHNVFMRMPLRHETMLISKSAYEKTGLYDTSYKIIADLKKTQQLFTKKLKHIQLNDYIMYFRNTGAASVLNNSFLSERKKLLMENFQFLDEKELDLLANEYCTSPPYQKLLKKYSGSTLLHKSIHEFLSLHKDK